MAKTRTGGFHEVLDSGGTTHRKYIPIRLVTRIVELVDSATRQKRTCREREHLAKQVWAAINKETGGSSFDGKPLRKTDKHRL